MKNLWPLLLLGVAFVIWNKSCTLPALPTRAQGTGGGASKAVSGGPVRQWEHEATDMQAREQALPPAGGLSSGAMIGAVQKGLQKKQ